MRTQLKSSTLQFQDGKTKSFIFRKRKSGKQKESKLFLSVNSRTHKEFEAIDGVEFLFERHGVFVHKGVGGYKADGTASVKHPSGNPRVPVEWFNQVKSRAWPPPTTGASTFTSTGARSAMTLHRSGRSWQSWQLSKHIWSGGGSNPAEILWNTELVWLFSHHRNACWLLQIPGCSRYRTVYDWNSPGYYISRLKRLRRLFLNFNAHYVITSYLI